MASQVAEEAGETAPAIEFDREKRIAVLEEQMRQAAKELEFEIAAKLRDEIKQLRDEEQ